MGTRPGVVEVAKGALRAEGSKHSKQSAYEYAQNWRRHSRQHQVSIARRIRRRWLAGYDRVVEKRYARSNGR